MNHTYDTVVLCSVALLCPTWKCGLWDVTTAYTNILYESLQYLVVLSTRICHKKSPRAYLRGTGVTCQKTWLGSLVQSISKAGLKVSQLPSSFEIRNHRVIQFTRFSFLLLPIRRDKGGSSLTSELPSDGSQNGNRVWGKRVHKELWGDYFVQILLISRFVKYSQMGNIN